MSYILQKHSHHADVLREDGRAVARVYVVLDQDALFPVCDDQGRLLFAVRKIEDAIQALENYYGKHSPPWQPIYTTAAQVGLPKLFVKRTPDGELRVQQTWDGAWFALRDGEMLQGKGGPAHFHSCEAARHTADRHLRDDFSTLSTVSDGYWWPDPEEERELDRKVQQLLRIRR
jgi:hypothetical protein